MELWPASGSGTPSASTDDAAAVAKMKTVKKKSLTGTVPAELRSAHAALQRSEDELRLAGGMPPDGSFLGEACLVVDGTDQIKEVAQRAGTPETLAAAARAYTAAAPAAPVAPDSAPDAASATTPGLSRYSRRKKSKADRRKSKK